jgi:Apea-like HEPN
VLSARGGRRRTHAPEARDAVPPLRCHVLEQPTADPLASAGVASRAGFEPLPGGAASCWSLRELRFLALLQALETLHARRYPRSKGVTFRTRIQRPVDNMPRQLRHLVPSRFVPLVVDTRNYVTHWDAKLGGRAAKRQELFNVTEGAKILFECATPRALGFSQTGVWQLMRQNPRRWGNLQLSFDSLSSADGRREMSRNRLRA